MTWVQAHPPGNTTVSSTKTQFQQNNLYIENTIQVDHYFDDATPSNDGHHKYVQMPVQAADPGVAISGGGCFFMKNTPLHASPSPFIQMGGKTYFIPVGIDCGNYVCNSGYTNTFNFSGYPKIRGWIYAFNVSSPRKAIGATFNWDGTSLYVNQRNNGKGQFVSDGDDHLKQFYSNGSSFVIVRTDSTITVSMNWMGFIV